MSGERRAEEDSLSLSSGLCISPSIELLARLEVEVPIGLMGGGGMILEQKRKDQESIGFGSSYPPPPPQKKTAIKLIMATSVKDQPE